MLLLSFQFSKILYRVQIIILHVLHIYICIVYTVTYVVQNCIFYYLNMNYLLFLQTKQKYTCIHNMFILECLSNVLTPLLYISVKVYTCLVRDVSIINCLQHLFTVIFLFSFSCVGILTKRTVWAEEQKAMYAYRQGS